MNKRFRSVLEAVVLTGALKALVFESFGLVAIVCALVVSIGLLKLQDYLDAQATRDTALRNVPQA